MEDGYKPLALAMGYLTPWLHRVIASLSHVCFFTFYAGEPVSLTQAPEC